MSDQFALIDEIRAKFPGCTVVTWPRRDDRWVAAIELASGSSVRNSAATELEALKSVLALATAPCPGFPGWVESPASWRRFQRQARG